MVLNFCVSVCTIVAFDEVTSTCRQEAVMPAHCSNHEVIDKILPRHKKVLAHLQDLGDRC